MYYVYWRLEGQTVIDCFYKSPEVAWSYLVKHLKYHAWLVYRSN